MARSYRVALLSVLILLVCAVSSSAMVLERSLNDLANDSSSVAVGRVAAIGYEVIDGHAWTRVTLAQEAYPQTGESVEPVEFLVPGGVIGDLIERVSDTPSFRMGERTLVMLRPGPAGKARLLHGLQSKIDIGDTGAVRGSSQSLGSLLSDIQAIRQGRASAQIAAPEPVSRSVSAEIAAGEAVTSACCNQMTADDGLPIRWSSTCPSIHYRIYDNSGISGAAAEIQQAASTWNAITCSCASLIYDGAAGASGDNICSWANLSSTSTIALTTTWYYSSSPHYVTKFQLQFNTYFSWSSSCASGAMDVQTIAHHELGHVLTMDDQYSSSCTSYTMYGYAYNGLCKHGSSLDEDCLAGLYPTTPTLSSFSINNGAASTTSTSVTLNNSTVCDPTQYMASESSSFVGASWLTYSTAPIFTLSSSLGTKAVYFKVKNDKGSSATLSDTITLSASGPTAPSSPGATNIAANSIRWTWADNSSNETGFKVYADAGTSPTTLRATTASNATYWDYTGLSANTQYAFQVAASDGTTDSTKTTAVAKYTLPAAPTFGSSGDGKINCDKGSGGSTWYPASASVTFTAVNGFGSGPTRASSYRYVWNTTTGEPSWTGASTWNSGALVLTPTVTGSYYLHIQAANADGAYNTSTLHLGPYKIDSEAPSAPTVTDSGAFQSGMDQLQASWASAADPGSGLCEYQYAIGTSESDLVVPWKSAGLSLDATESGLSLQLGSAYYWYVKARDCAGNWSAVGSSDGIIIVSNPATGVDAAKSLPDGATVGLGSKVVTAITETGFYIQDGPPWAGVRVDCIDPPLGLAVGSIVDVGGVLQTSADGEKLISGVAAIEPGSVKPHVVGLPNGAVGGEDRNYDVANGSGQQGVEQGVGLNNVGMLVRTWGRVLSLGSGAFASWDFDTDPGFSLQGSWAWGVPLGGGSHCYDPTSGHTGTKVIGYNLSGDYANSMSGALYATTPAVDCSGHSGVHLSFWRWLGVESSTWDHATVQVSSNAINWTTVYTNVSSMCDGAWVYVDYDISAVADGRPSVYVRWSMGPTDSSVTYPGWNIDDVELSGTGGSFAIDDGSGTSLTLEFPPGTPMPSMNDYVSVTGVCSCMRDSQGKIRPLVRVTAWKSQ